jgi:hypothetical protein
MIIIPINIKVSEFFCQVVCIFFSIIIYRKKILIKLLGAFTILNPFAMLLSILNLTLTNLILNSVNLRG